MLSYKNSLLAILLFISKPVFAAQCFKDRAELKAAVDGDWEDPTGSIAQTYGYPIGSWCTKDVTDMSFMFEGASSFNGDLSSWDVSSVTDMSYMFFYASSFNGDLSCWDISSVTNMNGMFDDASSFNQNLCIWGEKYGCTDYVCTEAYNCEEFEEPDCEEPEESEESEEPEESEESSAAPWYCPVYSSLLLLSSYYYFF